MKTLFSWLKWLYPGMRVKRWMFLTLVGIVLVVIGFLILTNILSIDYVEYLDKAINYAFLYLGIRLTSTFVFVLVGVPAMLIGLLLIFISYFQFNRAVLAVVAPDTNENLAETIFQRRLLVQGPRIVVIGGGTGLSTMLRGLKEHTSNIAAIVTVTDNGGSSGRLQQQMGVLPPGDLRNCLVALADAEPTLAQLFQYRFEEGNEGLSGHSFGNLFIAAMTSIYKGNYEQAIAATSKVLAIRGKVFPSTLQNVCLLGEMEDGTIIEGETEIASHPLPIKRMYLRPENAQPLQEVLEAIRLADAIILGPGSVFTSVIPNLLVDGVAQAISNSKAMKIYVCNVMTQPGETDGFSASDHIRVVAQHAPDKKLFTHVLVNTEMPATELLARYEQYGQKFVSPDIDAIRAMGYIPVAGRFISYSDVVRHDPARLAQAIVGIIM
jgi:uncharacterized cofD-like protein